MKRTASLKNSLPAIAKAITREKGIKLVFQGPPRTDGKTIYSNPLPVDADEDQVAMVVGNIDHECAHVLYTDFSVVKRINKMPQPKVLHLLTNSIEDPVIERKLGEDYLGCRETLRESIRILEEEMTAEGKLDFSGQPIARVLGHYLDSWGRKFMLGHPVERALEASRSVLEEALGEEGMMRLDAILSQEFPLVDSTEKSLDLACQIIDLVEEIEQEQQEPSESGDGPEGDGSEGDGSKGDGSKGDGSKGDGSKGDGSKGDGSEGDGSEGDGSEGDGSEGDGSEGDGSEGDGSEGDGSGDEDASQGGGAGSGRRSILDTQEDYDVTPLFDRSEKAHEAVREAGQGHFLPPNELQEVDNKAGKVSPAQYKELHDAISGQAKKLQRRILEEYQTRTRRRSVLSDEGRLDARRLARAVIGDHRIYRNRTKRMLPYPAVSVLMDASDSMCGNAMTLARQAMAVVAETNAALGVTTELAFFPGLMNFVTVVKGFDEPWNGPAQQRVAGVTASGGTPAAEALWVAGNRILGRKEERKLLFFVTDGAPNNPVETKEVADLIQKAGIELYGIGIVTDSVSRFCRNWSVIDSPEQIAGAILTAMRERILRAA